MANVKNRKIHFSARDEFGSLLFWTSTIVSVYICFRYRVYTLCHAISRTRTTTTTTTTRKTKAVVKYTRMEDVLVRPISLGWQTSTGEPRWTEWFFCSMVPMLVSSAGAGIAPTVAFCTGCPFHQMDDINWCAAIPSIGKTVFSTIPTTSTLSFCTCRDLSPKCCREWYTFPIAFYSQFSEDEWGDEN